MTLLKLAGAVCAIVLGAGVIMAALTLVRQKRDVPYERQWPDQPLVDDAQIHQIVKGGKR